MMKINVKSQTTSAGFTLIEVLVALLIVALGMLGNAMLQLQGMRNSNDAYLRSQISMIAAEIADKVRANRECQDEYASTSKFFGNVYTVGTSSGTSVPTCTYTAALGSAGMDNERNCIIALIENSLPPATTVQIEKTEITPDKSDGKTISSKTVKIFNLIINWIDRGGEEHNIQYSFDPGACVNRAACACT